MPVVIERILSASSEDSLYPAENLLKSDNNKKWKCKTGEKQASVIFQLKQDTVIEGIDIGNENSAFFEVLVGKSSSPNSDFKVLLVASSLMTLKEAKDGTNTNIVKFFKKTDLTKPTADEKWDRVKIVCTQPFKKHVQYGLSFIVLHSSWKLEESSGTLGRFALKEDQEQTVAVGSWFAKRNDPLPTLQQGAAAAIRDASSSSSFKKVKALKPTPKRLMNSVLKDGAAAAISDASSPSSFTKVKALKPTPKRLMNSVLKDDDEDSPADDTDADSTYSPNKNSASILSEDDTPEESEEDEIEKQGRRRKQNKKKGIARNIKNGTVLNREVLKRKNPDMRGEKIKVAKVNRKTKSFGQLLEGVIIVISGYQNPLRGELRSKACAMGAKYKADWDNSCTHLICAFVNTPKFNQVHGRGKIVKKEWVEECFNSRKRLPWRRFSLDRSDIGTSSEDEIWEEESIPRTSYTSSTITSGIRRGHVSSSSDTEEEIERVCARQAVNSSLSSNQNNKKAVDIKTSKPAEKMSCKGDPFADDTDIDSGCESQTANMPLPPLPDFFNSIFFYIACDISYDERKQLQRYITAYNGIVTDSMDGNVEYVITRTQDIATQVLSEFIISAVSPDWVWECSNTEKVVPAKEFLL